MTNKPRNIGTRAESAVVTVLRNYWPDAERRQLRGRQDWGDVTGTHRRLVWEVKAGAAANTASDGQVAAWLTETERERFHAKAYIGVLVLTRNRVGPANAGRWWAIVDGNRLGLHVPPYTPIRFYLGDLCQLLMRHGYGPESQRTETALQATMYGGTNATAT